MVTDSKVGDYVTLQRGITYKGNLVGKPGPALLGLERYLPVVVSEKVTIRHMEESVLQIYCFIRAIYLSP